MSVIRARSKVTVPTVLRADIQGLRAIAVLAVVAFHAALPVPGGFVGVDIFFVISGFVITVMLEREWRETGKVSFGRFYLRRFKRLTPALAMMIAITVILSAVIVSPLGLQQTTAKTAVGGIFLMANLVIAKTVGGYFDAVAGTNPLLHTWSLSVEEQFYLVFPALLVLGWIIARSRRRWAPHVIVAGLGASSLAVMLAPTAGLRLPGSESLWGFYSPLTRAWEFAAGALLALVLTHRSLTGTTATLTGTVGLGLVAASLTLIGEDTTFPGVWTALPVAGTLLLLAGGSDPAAPLSRLLSRGAMVGIGDWSYSIYLWHWPLIVFAGFLWGRNTVALTAAAALALVPALVSYTRLEQPLRNLGRLTRRRWQVVIALTVVPPVHCGPASSTAGGRTRYADCKPPRCPFTSDSSTAAMPDGPSARRTWIVAIGIRMRQESRSISSGTPTPSNSAKALSAPPANSTGHCSSRPRTAARWSRLSSGTGRSHRSTTKSAGSL